MRGAQPAPRERDLGECLDFLRDRARRSNEEVVRYTDSRLDRRGVEPICKVLRFGKSTYYDAMSQPVLTRRCRDEKLRDEILRVYHENPDGYYGQLNVWKQ